MFFKHQLVYFIISIEEIHSTHCSGLVLNNSDFLHYDDIKYVKFCKLNNQNDDIQFSDRRSEVQFLCGYFISI